jgi:hypothetical protein
VADQSPLLFCGDSGLTLLAFVNEIGKGSKIRAARYLLCVEISELMTRQTVVLLLGAQQKARERFKSDINGPMTHMYTYILIWEGMLLARGVRSREDIPQSQERQLSRFALPDSPEAWFFRDETVCPSLGSVIRSTRVIVQCRQMNRLGLGRRQYA